MTVRKSAAVAKADAKLQEALAVLISCTRNKKRPLPLTEISNWLEFAVAKLGSYKAVASRIGLSEHMLRQFSVINNLSPHVQELFKHRQLDSVDAAVHLSMLPVKEQNQLADALASRDIDTIDVRAAVRLRRLGQAGSIDKLLQRVKAGKTRQEYVAEFVIRGAHDRRSLLAAFGKHIPPAHIIRLELNGALGRLVLTQRGKEALAQAAKNLGTQMKHVIPMILQVNRG